MKMLAIAIVLASACGGRAAAPAPAPASATTSVAQSTAGRARTCDRCVRSHDGACATHSVSDCRWVLHGVDEPLDVVMQCDAQCCPAADVAIEMCPDYVEDRALIVGSPCPVGAVAGTITGTVTWAHPPAAWQGGLVMAQARGIAPSNSQFRALVDTNGHWSIAGLPAGDVTFSFYTDGKRTRATCTIAPAAAAARH